MSRQLKRLWKSLPLSRLKQGSTLLIRSTLPMTNVELTSQWRDDGHVEFQQILGINQERAAMAVSQTKTDQPTSLGRLEPHLSILLEPETTTKSKTELQEGDVSQTTDDPLPGISLSLQVPEKLNVICNLEQGGSIRVHNKIEGDATLTTTHGNIHVKKLRGYNIELKAAVSKDNATQETSNNSEETWGLIHATDLIEASNVTLESTGGRVRAKQIHGNSVDIQVHPDGSKDKDTQLFQILESDDEGSLIDVSSVYVAGHGGATLKVEPQQNRSSDESLASVNRRAVRVKTIHGPIRVEASNMARPTDMNALTNEPYPLVELGGINGNCEVQIKTGQPPQPLEQPWTSCLAHVDSLSPESVSLLSTDVGDIGITVDRKTVADLRLLSLPSTQGLEESAALLAEEEDSNLIVPILANLVSSNPPSESKISIETKSFTANPRHASLPPLLNYVEGWVDNKSAEPDSRFERKFQPHSLVGGGGGKIRVEGAAHQALKHFSEAKEPVSVSDPAKEPEEETAEALRPLLAAVGTGHIRVETLSWVGAIARRYGLDDGNRGLGRTAARRGRDLVPNG